MLTLLFIICMFGVLESCFRPESSLGISKFILTLVFLPLILIVMVAGGLISWHCRYFLLLVLSD